MSNGASSNTLLSSIDNLFQKSCKSVKFYEPCRSRKSDFITEKNSSSNGSSEENVMENHSFIPLKKKASSRRRSQEITLTPRLFEKIKPITTGRAFLEKFPSE